MQVKYCYYLDYESEKYPVVGIELDDKDKIELNDEPCGYMLFGDRQLADALEPFDTRDKEYIDNQIIYYFDDNICQRYMYGKVSDEHLLNAVKDAVLSWL